MICGYLQLHGAEGVAAGPENIKGNEKPETGENTFGFKQKVTYERGFTRKETVLNLRIGQPVGGNCPPGSRNKSLITEAREHAMRNTFDDRTDEKYLKQ